MKQNDVVYRTNYLGIDFFLFWQMHDTNCMQVLRIKVAGFIEKYVYPSAIKHNNAAAMLLL